MSKEKAQAVAKWMASRNAIYADVKPDNWGNYRATKDGKVYRIHPQSIVVNVQLQCKVIHTYQTSVSWLTVQSFNVKKAYNNLKEKGLI